MLDQLAASLGVLDIALGAGDVTQVASVEQPACKLVLEQVEHRRPQTPGDSIPTTVTPKLAKSLQALWDNDFVPLMLGVLMFLWATGLAVIRTGALPKWLGWVMVVLGVLGLC